MALALCSEAQLCKPAEREREKESNHLWFMMMILGFFHTSSFLRVPTKRERGHLGAGLGPGGVVVPPYTLKERKKERKSPIRTKASCMFVPSSRLIERTQHCFEYKMLLVMVRDTRRTDMQSQANFDIASQL